MERQLVVDFFADQGLTEESILENMSTKTYSKVVNDLFRKCKAKMNQIQKMHQKKWERTEE